jgi:hypothetical protein
VYVEPIGREVGKPFHVSGAIFWSWDALQTARTATTEDDLLAELLGREDARKIATERPWLRVDIELRAGLEYGKAIPMPSALKWTRWSREAIGRLENVEPLVTGDVFREAPSGFHAILAWQGEPELKVICTPAGELRLADISIRAFQGIDLPRRWGDTEGPADDDPHEQLSAMFNRVRAALYAWGEVMDHLV